MVRNDGRYHDQIRPLKVTYDLFGYADSSVLLECGETKVLVSISLKNSVPQFLRGTGTGWLTAEYSMIPCSTRSRSLRNSSMQIKNARGVEISRLIGRSFRSVVDLNVLGERTVIIDSDVLQADGGTRCACITAANLALSVANQRWLSAGIIEKSFLKTDIAAISVGIIGDRVFLDLSQKEDNNTEADFNFILTESGNIIEIQGTSEKSPTSWENFDQLKKMALLGIKNIFAISKNYEIPSINIQKSFSKFPDNLKLDSKKPLFCLGNRVSK